MMSLDRRLEKLINVYVDIVLGIRKDVNCDRLWRDFRRTLTRSEIETLVENIDDGSMMHGDESDIINYIRNTINEIFAKAYADATMTVPNFTDVVQIMNNSHPTSDDKKYLRNMIGRYTKMGHDFHLMMRSDQSNESSERQSSTHSWRRCLSSLQET